MTYPSDRQNWRVNGAGNVAGVIASDVRKATVRLAFMFPLSSTITDGHSHGDVECPFCFYPTFLQFSDRSIDGGWAILGADFLIVFGQNRHSDTVNRYRRTPFEVRYG
ncbi:hypothetical protein [Terasakiella pusilla]|uniref:hypothetical protein n=1 Tax=Terasakiella pusilla TaxID=64973 RepID=UPI0012EC2D92|nr:hypothetical protein [Terasakiella pusilla]